jgi:hypothetical protein
MYAETGAAMRNALAALLRQHRTQQRLGDSRTERAEAGTRSGDTAAASWRGAARLWNRSAP